MPYLLAARRSRLARVLLTGAIVAAGATDGFAAGSNTTTTAPTPVTPPSVTTSTPQAAIITDATCAQQLDTIGIVAGGVGLGTELGGTIAEAAAQAIPPPGEEIAEAAGLGTQIVGLTAQTVAYAAQVQATTLPSCEQSFTGTVTVQNGGVNVTGGSIFNGDVGVAGSVSVSGKVTASQVHATQGISADGGKIWLGDPGFDAQGHPNGTTYSDGITLGGGALSGAGFGGAQATTGDVSAIAIGNGASAFSVNTVALGTGATAGTAGGGGTNSTAVGANSSATLTNSAAFGSGATALFVNQQVFGTRSNTYTMPGLTSPASKARQTGPLELPTTDAYGNLASDGGETFKAIARLRAGVALSLATSPAVLGHGEKFGMRLGFGTFDGANALGFSLAGVIGQGVITKGDRLTIDGGVGFGFGSFMGYQESAVVGGRGGIQLTW